MRVGFERESYTTSEPSGAVQISVDVCMVVLSGAIGRQLSVAVQWQPNTAQGKQKKTRKPWIEESLFPPVFIPRTFVNSVVGLPGAAGDYVPPAENTFVFNVGTSRVCRQAIVFDDDRFEMSEMFSVQYTGIVLPDGTATPTVPGVMVQPSTATVIILDNDGSYTYDCDVVMVASYFMN